MQILHILKNLSHERQRLALETGAAGAADAVDIVVVGSRQVVIDDMRDADDVEPARGHVGGHQDLDVMLLEELERFLALGLALIPVNGLGLEALGGDGAGEPLDAVLGASEDEHLVEAGLAQERAEIFAFVGTGRHADHILVDASRGLAGLDGDGDWIFQKLMDERLDLRRYGGREEKRVAASERRRRWHLREHEFDFVDEAHVEHAVGFVEHDCGIFGEVEALAVDEVAQTAGRADQEIRPVRERLHLRHDRRAADGADRAQGHAAREAAELVLDLLCQLARRYDDQNFLERLLQDLIYERDKECRGLASAGVGDADEVFALKHVRDGLILNGSRREVFLGGHRCFQTCVNGKVGEGVLRHVCRSRHSIHDRFVDESRRIDVHAGVGESSFSATSKTAFE